MRFEQRDLLVEFPDVGIELGNSILEAGALARRLENTEIRLYAPEFERQVAAECEQHPDQQPRQRQAQPTVSLQM